MVCPSTPGFPLKRAGQRSFWGSGTQHESKTQTRRRAAMAMATKRRSGSFSKGNQQEIKRKQPWQRDWWKIVNQLPSQPICHGSGDSSYTCIVIFWNDLLENYAVLPSKHESWTYELSLCFWLWKNFTFFACLSYGHWRWCMMMHSYQVHLVLDAF